MDVARSVGSLVVAFAVAALAREASAQSPPPADPPSPPSDAPPRLANPPPRPADPPPPATDAPPPTADPTSTDPTPPAADPPSSAGAPPPAAAATPPPAVANPPRPVAPPPAVATESSRPRRFERALGLLLRTSLDVGGGELVRVSGSGSMASLRAGEGTTVSVGFAYQSTSWWGLEATLGYKWASADALGGSIDMHRIPLDALVSGSLGPLQWGVGSTVHFAPSSTCDVPNLCDFKVELHSALGFIAELAYALRLAPNAAVNAGVRVTSIQYSYGKFSGQQVSGLARVEGTDIGVFLSLRL